MAFLPMIRLNTQQDMGYAIRKKSIVILITLKTALAYAARRMFALCCLMTICVLPAAPSAAQGVVVKYEVVMPRLESGVKDAFVFYVNGKGVHWSGTEVDTKVNVGAFQKTILALVTLRLADSGTLSLDADISSLVPEIVPPDPFRAPITIRHLLQETAGFASPPRELAANPQESAATHSQLEKFAIIMRSPGQVSSHDPVGWAILIAVLEQVADAPIEMIIQQQLIRRLSGDGDFSTIMHLQYQSLGGGAMPLEINMRAPSLSNAFKLLVDNRDGYKEPYLARQTYLDLTLGLNGHRLHPNDSVASYGIQITESASHRWLEPMNTLNQPTIDWMAFPAQGAVFGAVSNGSANAQVNIRKSTLEIASEFFPPTLPNVGSRQKLARPSKIEGRYIPASQSPAGLSERLAIMQSDWLTIYSNAEGQLLVRRRGGTPVFYQETSPYNYTGTTPNDIGPELLFSPYRLGGYLVLKGENGERQLYRRIDSLGKAGTLTALIPWALLIVASAGIYAFRQPAKPWRNMGRFALAGALLVGGGLYFEITSWATVLFEQQQPVLITLWRTGLNIGLMLLLALPMFVFSFSRNKTIPTGGAKVLIGPHLTLVAAAALLVFMSMILWGVAGTFAPY